MTSVEDRLRAATRAAAATVAPDSAPPLRLPREPERRGPGSTARRHRVGWLRVVAPLTAAAAVIAVVAVPLAVTDGIHARHPAASHGQASPLAGLPPYYIDLTGKKAPYLPQRLRAVVRATATGATVATLTPPSPYDSFSEVAGAGDGRAFVLTAQKLVVRREDGGVSQQGTPEKFFLLRIGAAGRMRLAALPIPAEPAAAGVSGIALSPDGRLLAVAVDGGRPRSPSRLQVFTVATGSKREWTWRGGYITNNAGPNGQVLSWAADGRTLAFQLWRGRSIYVGVFDTASPGGLRSSKLPVEFAGQAVDEARGPVILNGFSAIITPDGTKIVCATTSNSRLTQATELRFTEFSASTGHIVHILDSRRYTTSRVQNEDVLWTNASGSRLIVIANVPAARTGRFRLQIGVVTGNRFTPLPGPLLPSELVRFPSW
jgi:hypothetical protein